MDWAFSGAIDGIDRATTGISAERVFVAALLGGTASVLSGGKFANGAITGAFSRAFNDDVHGKFTRENAARRATIAKRFAEKFEELTSDMTFKTVEAAEASFNRLAFELTGELAVEFGANVYAIQTSNGTLYRLAGWAVSTTFTKNGIGAAVTVGRDLDPNLVAFVHTHTLDSLNGLSFNDLKVATDRDRPINAFARNPDGSLSTFSAQKWLSAGKPSIRAVYYDQEKFAQ